jgi:phosphoglycerol transferase MdoB-like AlkP superfamily enzyme
MSVQSGFLRQFRIIFLSLGFLLVLHFGLRITFWIDNRAFFSATDWKEKFEICRWGFIMDLSCIIILNFPVFLFILGSQYSRERNSIFLSIAGALFIVLNTAGLAINILDIGYFPYNKHRSNADLWYVFADSSRFFKSIFLIYWPLFLLFFLLLSGLVLFVQKVFRAQSVPSARSIIIARQVLLIICLFLFARGLEQRPLIPASPLLEINARELPLAQNSMGTLLYSFIRRQEELEPKNYFTDQALDQIITSNHFMKPDLGGQHRDSMLKKNIVICILESFSACYLRPGDPLKARTPFFDSLIRKSIYFPNAYANGFSSNQGIVAILGGLPAFLDEAFYYSDYANTQLRSIGNILKEAGYNTNFFLGAGKDHFGFGKFTRMAGIDHYYSGVDFNDNRFDDGNWGIFDEPFFQFGARVLTGKKQPFLAVFYNISSHPPFTIPEQHRNEFKFPGQSPARRSISYVDYSFRLFFETCKKSPWFYNSIFVFCADHWLYPGGNYPYNYLNCGSIPIFIFDPSKNQGLVDEGIASQVDLTPTILDLLHYTGHYSGFGRSLLDSPGTNRYAINKPAGIPQIIDKNYILGYDITLEKSKYLYHYPSDSLLKTNLIHDVQFDGVRKKMEALLKANIQRYNQALIRRSLE